MAPTASVQLIRYEKGDLCRREDELASEEPLEIRVEGHSLAVVMRTPGHDRELAAGFLFSEGIIKSAKDLFDITTCVVPSSVGKGNVVDAALAQPSAFEPSKLTRHVFTSASCGVCSRTSIEAVLRRRKPFSSDLRMDPELILSLPRKLARHQEAFKRTGGLHACALFDATGKLLQVREDIGRHNALDKLVGWALLEKVLPLRKTGVLLSGRASFEMVQKAYYAGIPLVAAISAPSSLAVEFATESNQTLIGFIRGQAMNIYSGANRIGAAEKTEGGPS